MSELKPYRVVMYGHETTLMLDDADAKVWGVEGQAADAEPADLHDPDTLAAAEQAIADGLAEAAEKQEAADDAAAKASTEALVAEVEPKAAPVPARNKARRAPATNKQ